MDNIACEISAIWFAIGRPGIARVDCFLFLRSIVYRDIDKSADIARIYPRLHG